MTAHRATAQKLFAHRMFAHKTIAARTLARCEFCIDTGNQREAAADGLARTTNIVEGWHHSLQVILQCSHPTLWKFLSQLMNDCSKQKASFLQGSTGCRTTSREALPHPSRSRYEGCSHLYVWSN